MRVPAPVPLDQLLAHKAWLRRLAHALVKDPNRADDLEQEVWLRAMRTPPRSRRSLRGWLGTVLRRTAVDQHRADERRERHEGARASRASRTVPGAAVLAEQADTHRRVTDAVLALDEPYRSTLLLRYVGERSIKDVAREQGVPLETVRTRLRRALAKLRESLDVEYGGSKRWMAALVPLIDGRVLGGAGLATAATGGVLMGAKMVIAIGVVAACAAGWLIWGSVVSDPSVTEEVADRALPDDDEMDTTTLADAGASPALEGRVPEASAQPGATGADSLRAPDAGLLRSRREAAGPGRIVGRITDVSGKALNGVTIFVSPRKPHVGMANHGVTPDGDGYFSVHHLDAKEYDVTISSPGYITSTLVVRAGAESLSVELDKSLEIVGALVDRGTGEPLAGMTVTARAPGRTAFGEQRIATTDKEGRFVIRGNPPGTYEVSFGTQWQDENSTARFYVPITVSTEAGASDVRIEAVRGLEISGEIRDASGAIVTGRFGVVALARTEHGDPDYTTRRMSESREDGTFLVTGLTPGRYDLTFEPRKKGDEGVLFSAAKIDGVAAGTTALVVSLTDGRSIHGRIVDEHGNPVSTHGSLYVYPAGSMAGSQDSLVLRVVNGEFTTAPVDPTVAHHAYATHFEGYMSKIVEGVYAGDAEIVITLEKAGVISGHVEDESGKRVSIGVMVRAVATDVEKEDAGRRGTSWTAHTKPDGSFTMSDLGPYTFALAAGGGSSPYVAAKRATGIKTGSKGVVLVVKKGVTITGKLVDKDGNPVKTHNLTARPVGDVSASAWTRVTADDGSFLMRGIPAGKVTFVVIVGGKWIRLGTHDAPAKDVTLRLP